MSKFTTDELISTLYSGPLYTTIQSKPNDAGARADVAYVDLSFLRDAIIAKLEAADALYAIDKRMVVKTMTPPGVTIAEAAKWVKAIHAYKEA
jgi:hypothetical protein